MKTIDGPNIYQALLDVRRLHGHVARLLRIAEEVLCRDCSFARMKKSSTAIAGGSRSLDRHRGWMPEVAFRFLHHRDRPRHAVFVSVVLCPYKTEPNAVKFVEPLVSAGWVKYGADIPRKRWRRYLRVSLCTRFPRAVFLEESYATLEAARAAAEKHARAAAADASSRREPLHCTASRESLQ